MDSTQAGKVQAMEDKTKAKTDKKRKRLSLIKPAKYCD